MEQNEQRYNGWTNYETWVTALWLDNDQATQDYWREVARECRNEAPAACQVEEEIWTVDQAARFTLADRLKEEVVEGTPVTADASLYADLLGAALQEVNWPEIAGHWLDNLED
jgi:hypothetical protein